MSATQALFNMALTLLTFISIVSYFMALTGLSRTTYTDPRADALGYTLRFMAVTLRLGLLVMLVVNPDFFAIKFLHLLGLPLP